MQDFTLIWQSLTAERIHDLLRELQPRLKGGYVLLECPECHHREAYCYPSKDGRGPHIHCNRANNCTYDRQLWDYLVEREGDGKRAFEVLALAAGVQVDYSVPVAQRRREDFIRRNSPPPPEAPAAAEPQGDQQWRDKIKSCMPLFDTRGAEYVRSRNIPVDFAHAAGVRFHYDWFGHPAVLFPVRNSDSKIVACMGRYLDPITKPDGKVIKAWSAGVIREGVYATPGAQNAPRWVIVEGPFDALALALAGYPAVAVCGAVVRPWIVSRCALEETWLGFDADTAGDTVAEKWAKALVPIGARVHRLRPDGAKDWNEQLSGEGLELMHSTLRNLIEPTNETAKQLLTGVLSAHQEGNLLALQIAWHNFTAACDLPEGYSDPLDPFADVAMTILAGGIEGLAVPRETQGAMAI